MGEPLIFTLTLLGFLAPLLPTWRSVLIALALFIIADMALLIRIDADLAINQAPGPGARGAAVLANLPTVAFAFACVLRVLFELAKHLLFRLRRAAAADRTTRSSDKL